MNEKHDSGYRTRQRAAVLAYFEAHPHAHITAEILSEALRAEGVSIGKSTVYRTLDKLCESGVIRRFAQEREDGACYQYAGTDADLCHTHFHLKCLVCGSLYHVGCEQFDALVAHLVKSHNFAVDCANTVFYGTCAPCRRALAAAKTNEKKQLH